MLICIRVRGFKSSNMYRSIEFNSNLWSIVDRISCPRPWVQSNSGNGNWYHFSENKTGSFKDIEKYCQKLGGYVVNISSKTEYELIGETIGKNENPVKFIF